MSDKRLLNQLILACKLCDKFPSSRRFLRRTGHQVFFVQSDELSIVLHSFLTPVGLVLKPVEHEVLSAELWVKVEKTGFGTKI